MTQNQFRYNPANLKVAVVDDEPIIQETLCSYLEKEGYQVYSLDCAEKLRVLMEKQTLDLILLDIRLPDGDGLSLMSELHSKYDVAVILVTSKGEEADRIIGLELGADDYVTKPFSLRELEARIHSVLRRTLKRSEPKPIVGVKQFAGWSIDLDGHRLTNPAGELTRLTHAEFQLLAMLIKSAGRVLSRSDLITAIGGHEWNPNDRTIDVLIRRLRSKIEPNPRKPSYIMTEYALGYYFAEKVSHTKGVKF
ncbi:two component transcriptional regulator, winged helix family [Cohaesibacter sp. ES.047]|uniref:response regulator transcription factor n=1 Tax=Cohaesibacter sp. ES.047 TaxID=1798205 RepID=UPI000BB6D96F|nr:response regulator transcription factor [Cohaesibacter sp. ES.047]SNY91185.1 two component transcriptional regulator, winged helix family [Cohaesibacter sp. ES.047]